MNSPALPPPEPNRVIGRKALPGAPDFVLDDAHEIAWALRALLLVLAVGAVSDFLQNGARVWPILLAAFVVMAALVLAARRPRPDSARLIADTQGLYVPVHHRSPDGRRHTVNNSEWLQIPWDNVIGVGVQALPDEYGSASGLFVRIRTQGDEPAAFIHPPGTRAALSGSAGTTAIGIRCGLHSPRRLARRLLALAGRTEGMPAAR